MAPERGSAGVAPPPSGTAATTGDAETDSTLAHEAELLRDAVTEPRARIDELETVLDERDATVEEQRAQIETLEADLDELRAQFEQREHDVEHDGRTRREGLNPWACVSRWLSDR